MGRRPHRRRFDSQRAAALLEEGLARFRELDDEWSIELALRNLGRVALRQGDHQRATALNEESLVLSRKLGDKWAVRGVGPAVR